MAPANLLEAVRGGPIRSQANDVAELLTDPGRSQVILVTLPETTPVNEVDRDRLGAAQRRRSAPRPGRGQRLRRRSTI